ncbi:hypothetical protein FBU30_009523 [Linnemannia zychae]|nr:hypothetical protein FBU30_009523 [Linnemannia zychae]
MARFRSKLSLVLGLCLALALTKTAHSAAINEQPSVICREGSCYPRVFQPTTEFQEVLEGQEIPTGLHVQMDFETHKKYAKLMNPADTQEKPVTDSILVVDTNTPGTIQHQVGDVDAMPPAIDLHQDDFAQLEENSRMNLQTAFDSLPGLHKNQAAAPSSEANAPKSDHQIYTEIMETLNTSQNNQMVAQALEELTDLASDMDFGLQLSGGEGLRMLAKHLRCSSRHQIVCEDQKSVRSNAALVIGTALQNHAKAQESAYKHNLHKVLLTQLELESDPKILRRLVFAYSSLVRGAQYPIIQDDDIVRLAAIYNKSTDPQFRRKCIYLMSDFADPDMHFVPVEDDTTPDNSTNNETAAPDASHSEDSIVTPPVNVAPWCESLQRENRTNQDGEENEDWEIIDRAVELLNAQFPDTCILTGVRGKDEL